MAVTWTTTAPSVTGWSAESITGEYHYEVTGKGSWYSRIRFSIGRITGTRNVAIKAVLEGHRATGWVAQSCNATPSIQIGGTWYNGTSQSVTSDGTAWKTIGTQYAIITGLANGASVPCKNTRGGTSVSLTNPITAPAFRAKVSGSWKEAAAVYAKVSGTWKEASAGYAKTSGTWKEIQ